MKPTKLFLSWAHADRPLKTRLLADLMPALSVFSDVRFSWWEDSHLVPGEDLAPSVVERLDECDFVVVLLSNRYLGFDRPFIREHELPRFAGRTADKPALPVRLTPYADRSLRPDLGGVEDLLDFTDEGRSYEELSGVKRRRFAIACAGAIRRRVLDLDGYRSLR